MKKKPISYLKTGLIAFGGISLFLITSTIYDWIQGDMTYGRQITLYVTIPIVISVLLVLGFKRLLHMIQRQMGI